MEAAQPSTWFTWSDIHNKYITCPIQLEYQFAWRGALSFYK